MNDNIVPQNTLKSKTETARLTESVRMTSREFWGRLANNGQVRVQHHPGYLDVYKGDRHVARWLPYSKVLWYEPKDNGNGSGETWPPSCPDCGGPMTVKWGGQPRKPFWSCRHWDGPRPRVCEGRMAFSLHPDDLAEYDEYNPARWRELVTRSLARLNGKNGKA